MTQYVIEIVHPSGYNRVDSDTASRDTARRRRQELQNRGIVAQVRKGDRLVIDALGTERFL